MSLSSMGKGYHQGFPPAVRKKNWDFLAFFAENGREGSFLVQNIGGTFFLGGVK